MKDTLSSGMSYTHTVDIDEDRTIDFLGDALRVYATPEFVRDIEISCMTFLQEYCEEGESSVGISININHSGATPVGGQVKITATVQEIDGRRVIFKIEAHDGYDEVGAGSHGRFVVNVEQLKQRVSAKISRMSHR